MSVFDQLYQKLFKTQPAGAPLIYEPLVRTAGYIASYQSWLKSNRPSECLRDITYSIEFKKKGIVQQPDVHLLNGSMANGVAISYSDYFEKNEFSFLIDHLRDRAMTLGYKKANADLTIKEKAGNTETTEKHYVKPIINHDPPYDQKYGNILIEQVKINDVPSYLKLSANTYNDRQYKKALTFDDLISILFKTT